MTENLSDGELATPDVTWRMTFSVWWAIVWRCLALFVALAVMLGTAVFVIKGMVVAEQEVFLRETLILFGMVIFFLSTVWIVRSALQQRYRKFRIVLMPVADA